MLNVLFPGKVSVYKKIQEFETCDLSIGSSCVDSKSPTSCDVTSSLVLAVFTVHCHIIFWVKIVSSGVAVRCWTVGLAINRSWVQFPLRQSCVRTLGKLFTSICLCHQAV